MLKLTYFKIEQKVYFLYTIVLRNTINFNEIYQYLQLFLLLYKFIMNVKHVIAVSFFYILLKILK